MSEQVPLLGAAAVRAALPLDRWETAMAEALRAFSRGDVVQPLRSVIQLPDASGSLYTMPAFVAEPRALVVKLITVFHGNEARGLPSHQGLVVVFDDTGRPALLIDAASLTALRTAAVSAVATRALAAADAHCLAVLGTGVQARSHIDALLRVRPIRTVRIWGRTPSHAQALAAEIAGAMKPDVRVEVCGSAEQAVRGAHIICTVTGACEPVLRGAWLERGAHINAVGASTRTARELDTDAVARARIYVDSREAAAAEAGDLIIPYEAGRIGGPETWIELGGTLSSSGVAISSGSGDVTLFKSVGLAVEDAVAAGLLFTQRRRDSEDIS